MKYLSVKEVSELWEISGTMIRKYCTQGRIAGARQGELGWEIPSNAKKPKAKTPSTSRYENLPKLARNLVKQKTKKSFHGLYDYVQINSAYSSSRMASNRLTRNQVESIFRKGKVRESFEPMKVSDLIEVMNHCVCMDYILDHLEKPLSVKFIKMLHYLLMYGTVDARMERVTPGEYRNSLSQRKEKFIAPAEKINERLVRLIDMYERLDEVDRRDILDFHVQFERIFPFEDGNGRVGRLIMFKECLRHDVLPFILDDKRRKGYLTGLREWDEDSYVLTEVILEAQERFSRQVALQDLGEHRLDDLNDFDEEDW